MEPLPASSMSGRTARVSRMIAVTLMRNDSDASVTTGVSTAAVVSAWAAAAVWSLWERAIASVGPGSVGPSEKGSSAS